MKKEQLFLLLSVLLVFLLLFLTEFQKPVVSGKIEKITYSYPIRIKFEESPKTVIIFSREINLTQGNIIRVYGFEQIKDEIISNKISCLNC